MAKRLEIILYPEDGWTKETILDVINSKKSIKKYAFILHDQDVDEEDKPVKPHYHVYLGFGNTNVQYEHAAKWFGTTPDKVQRIKSNLAITLQYYMHLHQDSKHPYPMEAIVANINIAAELATHQAEIFLNDLIRQCADGTITPYNYTDYISPTIYSRHEAKFQRAWAYADQKRNNALEGQRSCHTIWVYGKSGTGKTTLCKRYADAQHLPSYTIATGKDPFSHYAGQPVLILDDLRPSEPFDYMELLRVIDPHYTAPMQSRYRNKILNCSLIFITTVYRPEDFVNFLHLSKQDSATQLYRRLHEVWYVTNDTIQIWAYHLDENKFTLVHTVENPVPNYIQQQKKPDEMPDSASVLNKISNLYKSNKEKSDE